MKHYIRTIKIILPFWLKPFKKFMKLDIKEHPFPSTLKGDSFHAVIIDEVGDEK